MDIQLQILDIFLVSPAIALFLASLIPLLVKILRGNKEPNSFSTMLWGLIGIVAAAGLTTANYGAKAEAFSRALVFDGVSFWSALVILFVTTLALFFSREHLATSRRQFSEFVFLTLNAAVGMLIVAWANDLIITFIGIEFMSLCLYILIAMSSEQILSKEAAFKYFVLGSFASALFLYGIAFIYGTVGSTYLPDIMEVAPRLISINQLFLFGVIFTVIGFAFKVSVFPFHAWTPDVYHGSSTPMTAFMATGVKVAIFAAFLRFFLTGPLYGEKAEGLLVALQWLAVLTMMVGNIAAIMQDNFKRMLAYSSVAHSGYAMMGLIAAGMAGQNLLGATSLIYYIFTYSIMTIGAFGVIMLFERRDDSLIAIDDLKGLASRRPGIALCITIFMLSLAGIPPTVGFFGKFFVFSAAVQQGLFWLAVWGVISSVISVYYYLRPVVVMYMSKEEPAVELLTSRRLSILAVGLSAILVVVIGLATQPFYSFVQQSVLQMDGIVR